MSTRPDENESQENAEFRREVRAWIAANKPAHPGFKLPQTFLEVESERQFVFLREWQRKVFDAELDFSVSENPTLRFHFVPHGDGELRAEVALRIEQSLIPEVGDGGPVYPRDWEDRRAGAGADSALELADRGFSVRLLEAGRVLSDGIARQELKHIEVARLVANAQLAPQADRLQPLVELVPRPIGVVSPGKP